MTPVTVAGGASVIAAVVLWFGWLERTGADRWAVAGVAAITAVGAAAATSGAPTGFVLWDAALRAGLAGVVVMLASRSHWGWLAVSATGSAWTSTGTPGRWVAFAAAGAALAFVGGRHQARWPRAVVAGAVVVTALQLSWPSARLGPSLAAACVLAPLVLSGTWAWRRRIPNTVAVGLVAFGGLALLVTVAAGIAGLGARSRLLRAVQETRSGLQAVEKGDQPGATLLFQAATSDFRSADRLLRAPWAAPALAVPGISPQERALRTVSAAGARLAATGLDALPAADPAMLRLTGGAFPVDRLARAAPTLQRAVNVATSAVSELDKARSPWLVPTLSDALTQMVDRVTRARNDAATALAAAQTVPAMLGGDGPRRYFLAILNPAESRASGGVIGDFGQITVDHGRMHLDRVGAVGELNLAGKPQQRIITGPADYLARYGQFSPQLAWENVPMSPDFPSVGSVMAQLYPQSGGVPVDGVIAVDPAGLAALLKIAGPVSVPGWPEPITSANAPPIFAHDQFLRYTDNDARITFLQGATRAIWERLLTSRLPSTAILASALLPSLHDRHVQLYAVRPAEETYLSVSGASGALPAVSGDSLGVVTQNASGNKVDWFLHRQITYRVRVDAATGSLVAGLDVTLDNEAPRSGEPPIVIDGDPTIHTTPGQNKTYFSVYSPWSLSGAAVNGKPVVLDAEREASRYVYSTFLVVPAAGQLHVHVALIGQLASPAARYQLDVVHQPTLIPDRFQATLVVSGAAKPPPPRTASSWLAATTTVWRNMAIADASDSGSGWDQRLRSHLR